MMRKNIIIALAAASLLSCPVGVSAAEDAGSIVEKMGVALEEVKYFSGYLSLDMPVSMEGEGMELEIPVSMKGSMKADTDSRSAEIGMELSISMMGEEEDQSYSMFLTEDGVYVMEDGSSWSFEPLSGDEWEETFPVASVTESLSAEDGFLKDAVLAEGMEERAGKECYKLECTVPLDGLAGHLAEILDDSVEGFSGDIEVSAFVGEEDYLLYGVDINADINASLNEGVKGIIKCGLALSLDSISYDEVTFSVPEEALAAKDNPVDDGEDIGSGDPEDIPIAEGEIVHAGAENGGIYFTAPMDMTDVTYDKTSETSRLYTLGEGTVSVLANRYSDAEEEFEFDLDYYKSDEHGSGFADVEETGFGTPLGDAKGLFFHSTWKDSDGETSVCYTSVISYMDINGTCYTFDYTVYDDVLKDDMETQMQDILDTVSEG